MKCARDGRLPCVHPSDDDSEYLSLGVTVSFLSFRSWHHFFSKLWIFIISIIYTFSIFYTYNCMCYFQQRPFIGVVVRVWRRVTSDDPIWPSDEDDDGMERTDDYQVQLSRFDVIRVNGDPRDLPVVVAVAVLVVLQPPKAVLVMMIAVRMRLDLSRRDTLRLQSRIVATSGCAVPTIVSVVDVSTVEILQPVAVPVHVPEIRINIVRAIVFWVFNATLVTT